MQKYSYFVVQIKQTMTSRITISLNPEVKKRLHLLAKKRQRTISRLINELIHEEAKKEKLKISAHGLGTYLSNLPLKGEHENFKNDKELVGKLKEEKHLRKA
ncbi:MAG TPA: CopG family transcriptional regulator [Chitinophagaceae bacterium]